MPFEIPENIHPRTARLAWLIGTLGGQRARRVPDDRAVPVRPGAHLPAGRPAVHPLLQPRPGSSTTKATTVREAAQETGFLRPQEDGTLEMVLRPQHRLRRDLARRAPPRAAALRDHHRRRRPHRDRQGVRRRQAALRLRRRRPALRLRHGGDGPASSSRTRTPSWSGSSRDGHERPTGASGCGRAATGSRPSAS